LGFDTVFFTGFDGAEPLQVSQEQFVANIEATRERARKD
jgi:hypothetical protein